MARIYIRPSVRRSVAEAIVEMATPGFSVEAQGAWYLVDGEMVVHRSATAAWNPWPSGADAIRVDQLLADRYEEGVRLYWFDPSPPDGDEDRAHDYWAGAVALAEEYVPDFVDVDGDGDPDPFAPLDPDIPDRVEFPVSYGHLRSLHDLLERMLAAHPGDDVVAGELSGVYDAALMLQAGGGYWDLHPLLLNARLRAQSDSRTDYYTARARALELAMRLVSEEESERCER